MVVGEERRAQIYTLLMASKHALSATSLAEKFGVSRQIIVGDIALLRASGKEIMATSRGYRLNNDVQTEKYFERKIVCQHTQEQTKQELQLIVDLGGEILDVTVEHPLYGEISGGLHIKTDSDIQNFMKTYINTKASLLLTLTNGIHLHTIRCKDLEVFEQIKKELLAASILYHNES